MNNKKSINGLRNYYGIEEITVIDGHRILFSGKIERFMEDCNPDMIPFRNEILKRTIEEKTVFNSKLFVFLEQPPEINDEDYEPITHFFKD